MFSHNTATSDGGAIDNGDRGSGGCHRGRASTFSGQHRQGKPATVVPSTTPGTGAVRSTPFLGLHVLGQQGQADGGAIDNADRGGAGLAASRPPRSRATPPQREGGAIDNADHAGTSTVWVAADIVNGSCDRPAGTWNDEGYNVGINKTCLNAGSGDVGQGANQFGPLANNGGPTKTMLALRGNPALGIVPLGTTVTLNGKAVMLCPGRWTSEGSRAPRGSTATPAPSSPSCKPPQPLWVSSTTGMIRLVICG